MKQLKDTKSTSSTKKNGTSPKKSQKSKLEEREIPIKIEYSSSLRDYIPGNKPRIGTKLKSTQQKIQSEETIVKACKSYLEKNGWECVTMFTGGIPIGGGKYATNPAKGIPDCIAFHIKKGIMIWIEYKKSHGGIVSPDQSLWHAKLKACKQYVFVVNCLDSLILQMEGANLC